MQLKTFCPYQVGDIYLTTAANDPTALWPGTSWQALQDCVLMAAGSVYAAGSTGGSATHSHTTGDCTLTTDQIPSHNHSVGAHAHGLNSHTHTLNGHTHNIGHTHTVNSHAHTYGIEFGVNRALTGGRTSSNEGNCIKLRNASGTYVASTRNRSETREWAPVSMTWESKDSFVYRNEQSTSNSSPGTGNASMTGTVNSGGNSGNTSAATGNTANSAAFNSGTAGGSGAHNHGNTGSSSNLPPYLAVYMWKRVA